MRFILAVFILIAVIVSFISFKILEYGIRFLIYMEKKINSIRRIGYVGKRINKRDKWQ